MIVQTKTTPQPMRILCMGDSQTKAFTYGVNANEFWPSQLQTIGLSSGYSIITYNCGNSGWVSNNNSTNGVGSIIVGRLKRFRPHMTIINIGVNDLGNGIANTQTQTNIQYMIDASISNGSSYVLIVSTNYLNWSSGGDNVGFGTTGYYTAYQNLRQYQLAAANYGQTTYGASKVGYCDLYTYQSNLISNGQWTQGIATFGHVEDLNQHMNYIGHNACANAIWSSILSYNPPILSLYRF